MRLLVALFIFLYTQLSQAAPSSLSTTEHKRSHLSLFGELANRSPHNKCGSHVALSWYVSWHSGDVPLSAVSWSKYTSVIYSFATTQPNNAIGLSPSDEQLLPEFVKNAKQNHVNAILAIGGWGPGSQYFSSAVSTETNRVAFAQAIMATVKKYGLDGIDFDWEFPGSQSVGCKSVASWEDTGNFLLFLQTLRAQKGAKHLILSAAVTIVPWTGSDGQPSRDVSGFGKVLDYIEIMNYEIWGPWSASVGPNAPLDDSCAASPHGSAKSAIKAWTGAGFPIHKIVLGVPSFGHSYHVDPSKAYDASGKLKPYVPFDKALQPSGDKWDAKGGGVDGCGNQILPGGIFQFWGMIENGFLDKNGNHAKGIDYVFDQCSQTPFVYNRHSEVMVSYDNALSFAAKGHYIKSAGLAGFVMWETGGDSHNILLNSINSAVGNTC